MEALCIARPEGPEGFAGTNLPANTLIKLPNEDLAGKEARVSETTTNANPKP